MADVHTTLNSEAIHRLIAIRAYELWEEKGRPHGYELVNWHQAEQEILACIGDGQGSIAQPDTKAKSAQ